MPLFLDKEDLLPSARLLVWKTTETTEELVQMANLSPEERAKLQSIVLEKRQREWLDTRLLLKQYHADRELTYLPNGKPVFKDGSHLSISHCEEYVGIISAPASIGMDIQSPDKKLLIIQKKFCNAQELAFILEGEEGLVHTTMIWSIKEAIFKVFGENVLYAGNITVSPFNVEDEILKAHYKGIHGEREFELVHFMMERCHVVVTQ